MYNKEIRLENIPCLEFVRKYNCVLYVGPRLSWWRRRTLKKFKVIYLYEILDGITKGQLDYNFPGMNFPRDFSVQTVFSSIREFVKEHADEEMSQDSMFFIMFNGKEFVIHDGSLKLKHKLRNIREQHLEECSNFKGSWILRSDSNFHSSRDVYELGEHYTYNFPYPKHFNQKFESSTHAVEPYDSSEAGDIRFRVRETSPDPIDVKSPEEVREAIMSLLMTGFPAEVIKSWLEENVKLSRLRITKQFKILLVDYNIEIKMRPLPKTVFLFYLRHPEGVGFSYLQDHVKELRYIYERLCRNDSQMRIEASISSLINPFNNSISEKCSAVKYAFLEHVKDEISKHYYIRGAQGGKKGIALDRSLVEWECDL